MYPLTTDAHELAGEELYLLTDEVALSKCGSCFWFWKSIVVLNFTSGTKCSGTSERETELQCSLYNTLRLVCSHLVVHLKSSVVVYIFHLPEMDVFAVGDMSMICLLDSSGW